MDAFVDFLKVVFLVVVPLIVGIFVIAIAAFSLGSFFSTHPVAWTTYKQLFRNDPPKSDTIESLYSRIKNLSNECEELQTDLHDAENEEARLTGFLETECNEHRNSVANANRTIASYRIREHWTDFADKLLEIYLAHVEWAPSLADRYPSSIVPRYIKTLRERLIARTKELNGRAVSAAERRLALARLRATRYLLRDTYRWLVPIIQEDLPAEEFESWIDRELRFAGRDWNVTIGKAHEYLNHIYGLAESKEHFRIAERFGVDRSTSSYKLRRKEQEVAERKIFDRFIRQGRLDQLIEWLQAMPEGSPIKREAIPGLHAAILQLQGTHQPYQANPSHIHRPGKPKYFTPGLSLEEQLRRSDEQVEYGASSVGDLPEVIEQKKAARREQILREAEEFTPHE